jgi:hypothetical protein
LPVVCLVKIDFQAFVQLTSPIDVGALFYQYAIPNSGWHNHEDFKP